MSLEKYLAKRKFDKTKEPPGQLSKKNLSRFVIQKHRASHWHYDFRLEHGGVLKSWAVPKGVPTESGIKRLAIAVEDHPVEYLTFSGRIPAGHYGAGTVEIWDQGKWEKIEGSLKSGSLEFKLEGLKLKGEYVLVKLKDGKSWLIFKKRSPCLSGRE